LYSKFLAGMSIPALSKESGFCESAISKGFRKAGWETGEERQRGRGSCVKSYADHEYFEILRSPEEAYAYGLFLTDGSISKSGFRIALQPGDSDVLKKIRDHFYRSDPKLGSSDSYRLGLLNGGSMVSFEAHSARVRRLLRLRFGGNKTTRTKAGFDTTRPDLCGHLLRGIVDGDGWVSISRDGKSRNVGVCSVNRAFLEEMQAWLLKEHAIESRIHTARIKGKEFVIRGRRTKSNYDLFSLHIGSHLDLARLYRVLYGSGGPCITRKAAVFERINKEAQEFLGHGQEKV